MAIELTEADFAENTGGGLVLVDFWAEWCGPCKAMAPVLDELTDVKVVKVNTEKNQKLALEHRINALPTLVFLKDGQEVARSIGVQSQSFLQNKIDSLK